MSDQFHVGLLLDLGAIDLELQNLQARVQDLHIAALGNAALPTIKDELERTHKYASRIASVSRYASERIAAHITRKEARAA